MSRYIKPFSQLDLIDDYLFNRVASDPDFGERFARILLSTILGKTFSSLHITTQRVYYGSDPEKKGIRLDLEIDAQSSVAGECESFFNIEVENQHKKRSAVALESELPRRLRFYHSKHDAATLRSGKSYGELCDSYVIMIMNFDPFGEGLMRYTIESSCRERPELEYNDGIHTLLFYTGGQAKDIPEDLRLLLRYFSSTDQTNAANSNLKDIQEVVNRIKSNNLEETTYMTLEERIQQRIRDAVEEAVEETQAEDNSKFVNSVRTLAEAHPDWTTQQMSEELMRLYS